MDRITHVLLVVGGVLLLSFMLFGRGGGGSVSLIFVLVPLVLAGGVWFVFGRTGRTLELGWGGRAEVTAAVDVPTFAAIRPRSTQAAVAAALGRFEARKHATSTWFVVGTAMMLLMLALFGWVWVDPGQHWRFLLVHMPIMAFPMVGMAVGAGHLSVTRARRDGATELFDACPATATTRTLGQLRAAWVPALALVLFIAAMVLSLALQERAVFGSIDANATADVITAIVLGACGVALGVALGRWAPWRLAPIVALFVVMWASTLLGSLGEPHWSNVRQLSTWPRYPPHSLLFTDRPVWWHLAWIVALGALMVVIAVMRTERSRRVLTAGAVVVVALVVAGVMATRPISAASARHIASLVVEPAEHQTCVSATRVLVCAYDDQEVARDDVLAAVAPIAAAAPDGTPDLHMRQLFDGRVEHLGPDVAAAIAALAPTPALDDLAFGFERSSDHSRATRIRAAVRIAMPGLGGEPAGHVPLVVAGESRGVVALWLGAQGLSTQDAVDFATVRYDVHLDEDQSPDAWDLGNQGMWPDACEVGAPPVVWSQQDLAAARQLLGLAADDVRALFLVNWSLVTDPSFGTDELMSLAGLPAVGPFDRITMGPIECSWS